MAITGTKSRIDNVKRAPKKGRKKEAKPEGGRAIATKPKNQRKISKQTARPQWQVQVQDKRELQLQERLESRQLPNSEK